MIDKNKSQVCINCGTTEQHVPLISIRFNQVGDWICTQCLPMLIHNPKRLSQVLPGIKAVPTEHGH